MVSKDDFIYLLFARHWRSSRCFISRTRPLLSPCSDNPDVSHPQEESVLSARADTGQEALSQSQEVPLGGSKHCSSCSLLGALRAWPSHNNTIFFGGVGQSSSRAASAAGTTRCPCPGGQQSREQLSHTGTAQCLEDAPEGALGVVELEKPEKRRKGMFSTCGLLAKAAQPG